MLRLPPSSPKAHLGSTVTWSAPAEPSGDGAMAPARDPSRSSNLDPLFSPVSGRAYPLIKLDELQSAGLFLMTPTRETFGNIPHAAVVIFYLLTVLTLSVLAFGVWRRCRLWRQGVPIGAREWVTANLRQIWARLAPGLRRVMTDALAQKRGLG